MKMVGAHVVFYKMLRTPFDKDGNQQAVQAVLLYKRTQDAPAHPGYWALFGGELEEQEDAKSALQREVKEELEAAGLDKTLQCLCPLGSVVILRRATLN